MMSQSAIIETTSSGNLTVVPAMAGQRIKVVGYHIVCGGTTNVKFTDGAGGATIEGTMPFTANTGICVPMIHVDSMRAGEAYFMTSINTALVLNNSAAERVGGSVNYVYTNA